MSLVEAIEPMRRVIFEIDCTLDSVFNIYTTTVSKVKKSAYSKFEEKELVMVKRDSRVLLFKLDELCASYAIYFSNPVSLDIGAPVVCLLLKKS